MLEQFLRRLGDICPKALRKPALPPFFTLPLFPIAAGSLLGAGDFRLSPVLLLLCAVFFGSLSLGALLSHRRLALAEPARVSPYFFAALPWPYGPELLLPLSICAALFAALFGLILCLVSGWGLLLPGFLAFFALYLFGFDRAFQKPGLALAVLSLVEGVSLGLAAFYGQTGAFSVDGLVGVLPLGLMLAAFHLCGEIRDRETDLAAGYLTLPNTWGAFFAYRLFYILTVLAYLLLLLNVLYGVTDFWPLLVFLTVPAAKNLMAAANLGALGDAAAERRLETEMASFYPKFALAYVFALLLMFAL